MRKEYKKELEQIKIRMGEAEKFAEKLPIYAEQILNNKYTGNEDHIKFGEKYKDIYLGWGISRGLYKSDTNRTVSNYKGSYTEFLFHIYVNSYSLFGGNCSFNLDKVEEKAPVFFYDKLNSTFYATDGQITDLLEELNNWYLKAVKENDKLREQENNIKGNSKENNDNKLELLKNKNNEKKYAISDEFKLLGLSYVKDKTNDEKEPSSTISGKED